VFGGNIIICLKFINTAGRPLYSETDRIVVLYGKRLLVLNTMCQNGMKTDSCAVV
jgi:hypothetical protein